MQGCGLGQTVLSVSNTFHAAGSLQVTRQFIPEIGHKQADFV